MGENGRTIVKAEIWLVSLFKDRKGRGGGKGDLGLLEGRGEATDEK